MITLDILKDMYSTYMSLKKTPSEVDVQATVTPKKSQMTKN